jgi:hypothetical protein
MICRSMGSGPSRSRSRAAKPKVSVEEKERNRNINLQLMQDRKDMERRSVSSDTDFIVWPISADISIQCYRRDYYTHTLIKKENKIFLIYKKIQMGSGAKSYMRKGFLIYEEMHKYFLHIWGGR